MFKTRLASGVVLVIILLLVGILGGNILFGFCGIISIIATYELMRVLKLEKSIAGVVAYVFSVLYYIVLWLNYSFTIPEFLNTAFVATLFMITLLAVYVFSYPKFEANHIFGSFFSLFYVSVMLSYIYQTRMLESGQYLVWLIFICSWGCDTCAYCVGVLFGKHKMSPVLSPKKSVEGAVGGVVGAILIALIFLMIFKNGIGISTSSAVIMALFCGVGGLVSMVGDLAASAIKRNYDIKDYGTLIPGHGGILDRFDSVIITAPIIYYIGSFLV